MIKQSDSSLHTLVTIANLGQVLEDFYETTEICIIINFSTSAVNLHLVEPRVILENEKPGATQRHFVGCCGGETGDVFRLGVKVK